MILSLEELRRLASPETEARVIAEVICSPERLALAMDLEVDDFVDYRNREVFETLRNLEAQGHPIGLLAICNELEHLDVERDRHVAEKCGLRYLAALVCEPSYDEIFGPAAICVFEADLRHLRLIRNARKDAR